jgi:copper(I)-binding protein
MFRSSALAFALFAGLAIGAEAAEITINDPYARAVPPGQPNSAVFLSLTNSSAQDRALVGAESPAAGVTELHTHVNEDGMMRMRRIDRIELPAGETVTLKPGGLHVMLIGL